MMGIGGAGMEFPTVHGLGYSWTQAADTVTITVDARGSALNKRVISAEIKRSKVKAGLKGQEPFLEGNLMGKVSSDDSYWQIDTNEGKPCIVLHLEKEEGGFWPGLFSEEPKVMPVKDPLLLRQAAIGEMQQHNLKSACDLFKQAAELNDAQSALFMGQASRPDMADNLPVEKDFHLAFKYLKIAADQGLYEAMVQVGSMLKEGTGCEKKGKEAAEYLKKAADAMPTKSDAMLALAKLYNEGCEPDLPADKDKAYGYFSMAGEKGCGQSALGAGMIKAEKGDWEEAKKWLLRASQLDGSVKDAANKMLVSIEKQQEENRKKWVKRGVLATAAIGAVAVGAFTVMHLAKKR